MSDISNEAYGEACSDGTIKNLNGKVLSLITQANPPNLTIKEAIRDLTQKYGKNVEHGRHVSSVICNLYLRGILNREKKLCTVTNKVRYGFFLNPLYQKADETKYKFQRRAQQRVDQSIDNYNKLATKLGFALKPRV